MKKQNIPLAPAAAFESALRYKVRSVFFSDVHLGTRNCRDGMLLNLMHVLEPDNVYLVGDVIDAQALSRRHYWPQGHENVMHRLKSWAGEGRRVTYVPGNHDEGLRPYLENRGIDGDDVVGEHRDPATGIILKQRDLHVGVDGRKHLVTHGDRGDAIIHSRYGRQLAMVGDVAYEAIAKANRYYNHGRAAVGLPYHALDGYIKRKFKSGQYMKMFRTHIREEAEEFGAEGVICGHMHTPELHNDNGLDYKNCGDMVASITAVVESHDGRFTQLNWAPIHNAYKWAAKQGLDNPAQVFDALVTQNGAIAVPMPVAERFNPLAQAPQDVRNVESAYTHLIRAASLDYGDKAYARRVKAARQMGVSSRP